MNDLSFSSPSQVAEAAEKIYADKYKSDFEGSRDGEFVAIDVKSGEIAIAEFPEQALKEGLTKKPSGIFHLIRIGASGAFQLGFVGMSDADSDWALQFQ